ncbi:hypothetical protein GPECTOR_1g62 [Gonium pectorale]|uniref:Histone deacetylase domain-containing protein n=1 Tax=Gonium pectorale TaxID=33097 RepID=A0A150H4D3_GONPE|nr:hypothetical protein GPECTOR_1g62 [Gonium pectorale]|eukprot:KXZ56688.1 hypothetical protein GPECTOR_1g62 [Gonium pectorale]
MASDVLLVSDARMLLHRSSLPPYPGRPERLQAIMARLHSSGLMARCRLLRCRPASEPELLAVHSKELISAVQGMGVRAAPPKEEGCTCSDHDSDGEGGAAEVQAAKPDVVGPVSDAHCCSSLCADTLYNAHTGTAAMLAAGAAADLGVALAAGKARRALAVIRPPGAQAGVDLARGGCYYNNVAVAAAAALNAGARRVMVVDWDVHHGRGTAEIFADDPRVMVLDMHRYDSETYPGSGAVEDVGEGEGEGTTLNIAFGASGLADGDLLSAGLHVVLPVALQFRPDVMIVSAGFGALKGDPIGGCECSPAVFAHLTYLLAGVAPKGLGLLLEGGYNLSATADAVEGCLRVLQGEAPPPLPGPWATTSAGWVGIMNAMQIHSRYWSSLHPLSFNGWVGAVNEQQRQMQESEPGPHAEAAEPLLQQPLHSPPSGSFDEAGGFAGYSRFGYDEDALEDTEFEAGNELQLDALKQLAVTLRRRQDAAAVGRPAGDEELMEEGGDSDPDPAEVLDFILGTTSSARGTAVNSDDDGALTLALELELVDGAPPSMDKSI